MNRPTIYFKDAPSGYTLCINKQCPKSSDCIRYQAYLTLPKDMNTIQVVNPSYAEANAEACRFHRPIQFKTLAYDFSKNFNNMTKIQEALFRSAGIAYFGRSEYYRLRGGEKGITPEDQEFLLNRAEHVGFKTTRDEFFDRFTDVIDW